MWLYYVRFDGIMQTYKNGAIVPSPLGGPITADEMERIFDEVRNTWQKNNLPTIDIELAGKMI